MKKKTKKLTMTRNSLTRAVLIRLSDEVYQENPWKIPTIPNLSTTPHFFFIFLDWRTCTTPIDVDSTGNICSWGVPDHLSHWTPPPSTQGEGWRSSPVSETRGEHIKLPTPALPHDYVNGSLINGNRFLYRRRKGKEDRVFRALQVSENVFNIDYETTFIR